MTKIKKIALQQKRSQAINILKQLSSVIVALSGGVDSAVVAALAFEALKDKAMAVTFDSPLITPQEIKDARAIADSIGIRHQVHVLDELKIDAISKNPENRCYHCKLHRFQLAQELARKLGFEAVVDGSTASDIGEHRPGLQAIEELKIISPLQEAGITKEEARWLAHDFQLPVANKPSNSCLATRVPYNEPLTKERLTRIAAAEKAIHEITSVDLLRVRDHGVLARIEVTRRDFPRFLKKNNAQKIVKKLMALGYKFVTIDLQGYRFGSFDDEQKYK
ncbi:MAG: ATP-dependent sacrificial sulfur transferase LarE [Candidatus Thorarchaeota archaeon]